MMEQKNGAEGIFRPMRRKKQALSRQECEAVLKRGTSGVLALWGYAALSWLRFEGSEAV